MKSILTLGILFWLALDCSAADTKDWPFKVFLDDTPVGSHRFRVEAGNESLSLISEARFKVNFLAIPVYTYDHRSEESWRGNCLTAIQAKTMDNGTETRVAGQRANQDFKLRVNDGQPDTLPDCIMTFAYWNAEMLKQNRLLNPQTGEWTPVTIRKLGQDSIQVGSGQQQAEHYHLKAEAFDIDLWYDSRGNWLALDSKLENGSLLRYRLD